MDVGIACSIFVARNWCIHSSYSYLFFQIMEKATSITFPIHIDDGNIAYGWRGIVNVYGFA